MNKLVNRVIIHRDQAFSLEETERLSDALMDATVGLFPDCHISVGSQPSLETEDA